MNKINLTETVPAHLNQERLDRALAQIWPKHSRAQHKQWILSKSVSINGVEINKPRHKVHEGDLVAITATMPLQTQWRAQQISLNIVYEDKDIIVINKPPGLVVHPGAGNIDSTLANALLHHCPGIESLPRCGLVHRLDKDTTGLMISAKSFEAYTNLTQMMQERLISREYQAIVQGLVISGSTIDEPVGRHPTQRTKMAVTTGGKFAITHYWVNEKFRAHSLLDIKLETGRTHQIRVHLTHKGYPIVGDPTYKKQIALEHKISPSLQSTIKSFPRQALHAKSLTLPHPVTSEPLQFEIELPADMQTLLSALRESTE